MTDRGSAFKSFKAISRFERLLEELEVSHFLAREPEVNGKPESLIAAVRKELVRQIELHDWTDALRQVATWVRFHNYKRTAFGSTGPGPPVGQSDVWEGRRCEEMALTIRVLEYRTRRLDAVVEHGNRMEYSPSFRRFILEEYDWWAGTRAGFAAACRLPLDTLKAWLSEDREGIRSSPPATPQVAAPVNASETTKRIVQEYEKWQGSTKAFLGVTAQRHGLTTNQVRRVLTICGEIASRTRRPFLYRGSTARLSPG